MYSFKVIWEFSDYYSEPKQILTLGRDKMEASMDPCLHLPFPLSHKKTGWYPGRLRFFSVQTSSGSCVGSSSSLAFAAPSSGIWGHCPSPFLLSSTQKLSALDSHTRPRLVLLLQMPLCTPVNFSTLWTQNQNSASCQIIWLKWWILGCQRMQGICIFKEHCSLLKRISRWWTMWRR